MDSDSDSSALTDLSSELSSLRSRSPSPVFGYPSPQSSQEHNSSCTDSQQGSRKRPRECDDGPPAKKRKSLEAKPRTTVHLDLRSSAAAIDQTSQLALLLKTLRKRRKIVVIAGAGISTSAGIPDFRSSNGLFASLRSENKLKASGKHLFDASVYQTNDATSSFHDMHNPDDEAIGAASAADLRARPDAVIVVGTSLEIPGVKRMVREMCKVVRGRKEGDAIWINRNPPPIAKEFEDCWDLIVAGDCDTVAQRANMRRWNDEGIDYRDCTESEAERVKNETGIKVLVKPQKKKSPAPETSVSPRKSNSPAMPTPADSPKVKTAELPKIFQFPPLNLKEAKKKPKVNGAPKKSMARKTISKSSSKSQLTKVSVSRTTAGLPSIKTSFKVTKVQARPDTPKKQKTTTPPPLNKLRTSPTGMEKAKRLLEFVAREEEEQQQSHPMAQISPTSARYNGQLSPNKDYLATVKLEKVEVPLKVNTTNKDDNRLKRMSEEVVSPTGSPPRGMNGLLCNC
ncbi:hypothetical protein P7C71_g5192, partial [Lecanoromycetidae sp. Uapishka_2]